VLFQTDPYFVKHWRKVWGTEPLFDFRNRTIGRANVVIDHEPEHMPLPEQCELAAQKLRNLGVFHFLTRPAIREGEVSQAVIPISIAGIVRDRKTGEYVIPDSELVGRVRSRLTNRSGIPAATINQEQEARLTQGSSHKFGTEQGKAAGTQAAAHAAAHGNGRQPASEHQHATPENVTHPEPHTPRETQSLPALDEQQHAFLRFIIANPDTPVYVVYKELGVGVAQGTRIRESLKAQELVEELEVRASSKAGGRPTKCLIPTVAALELLGKEPPAGRGGILHRHVQQVVAKGASAKGYIAKIEHPISTEAIVDVHLERGERRIAVEIAIASLPEREINHIRNCLAYSYDQVYTIFADEHLLGRTATAAQRAFSGEELGKIRLSPLRHLAQVI
jgi:hypothetical protein